MKGALVEFASAFDTLVPNVIVFQFNPETLRHGWTQPQPVTMEPGTTGGNPLAVQGMPGETFSFTLMLDITDQIADGNPASQLDGTLNGLYTRLAALEMLMFPVPNPPTGSGDARETPAAQVPTVLFVWGVGRIVPVRVTSLTITEKLFDSKLNPTHADAVIELRVLTPAELDAVTGPLADLAQSAYSYTQNKRKVLALLNLNNAAGAIDLPPLPGA